MAEAVQGCLLAGDRVESQRATHDIDRSPMQQVAIWIVRERQARKLVPPHVADTVQGSRAGFVDVTQYGGAAPREQVGEDVLDRLDAAQAHFCGRGRTVEPPVVARRARAQQISKPLRNLRVGKAGE